MDGHARVLAAAALPGVLDVADVIEAADHIVLEVAAILAGRPPRGATQRRFVDFRSCTGNRPAPRPSSKSATEHGSPPAPRSTRLRRRRVAGATAAAGTRECSSASSDVWCVVPCFAAWDDCSPEWTRRAVRFVDGLARRTRRPWCVSSREQAGESAQLPTDSCAAMDGASRTTRQRRARSASLVLGCSSMRAHHFAVRHARRNLGLKR